MTWVALLSLASMALGNGKSDGKSHRAREEASSLKKPYIPLWFVLMLRQTLRSVLCCLLLSYFSDHVNLGLEEAAPQVHCLPWDHEGLSQSPEHTGVSRACNSCAAEAAAGGLPGLTD